MSVICDFLLITDYTDGPAIEHINAKLAEVDTARQQRFERLNVDGAGGNKYFTADLYAAAFNHLTPGDVMDAITSAPWRQPEEVFIFMSGLDYDISPMTVSLIEARTVTS